MPTTEELPLLFSTRSTFTRSNAERFRTVYDTLLTLKAPLMVEYSKFPMTPSTLQTCLSDALKYLAECADVNEVFRPYQELKDKVSRRREASGILLLYRGAKYESFEDTKKAVFILAELLTFIEEAQQGETFIRANVVIKDSDRELITTVLAPGNSDFKVDLGEYRVQITRL